MVITYPTPPYSNPPIQPQNYIPNRFEISGITLGQSTTVETILDMNYVIGQEIRLFIPPSFGCFQLNKMTGFVLEIISDNEVLVSIDSSQNVNEFTASSATTRPQIIAVGDINTGTTDITTVNSTYVPGSFRNISPA